MELNYQVFIIFFKRNHFSLNFYKTNIDTKTESVTWLLKYYLLHIFGSHIAVVLAVSRNTVVISGVNKFKNVKKQFIFELHFFSVVFD